MITRDDFFPRYLARDPDIEVAWLGLALLGKVDPLALVWPGGPYPFYDAPHQVLWNAMVTLRQAGQPSDIWTVGPWLAEHDQLEKAGGSDYLQTCLAMGEDVPEDPPEGEPSECGAQGAAVGEVAPEGKKPDYSPGPRGLTALLVRYALRRHVINLSLKIYQLGIQRKPMERFPIDEVKRLVEQVAGTLPPDGAAPAPPPPPPAPQIAFTAPELAERPPEDGGGWLVERLLVRGGVNLLAGEVASGKTFLALDLALSVAAGLPAWDGRPALHGPVLYYCLDSGPRILQERLNGLCLGRGLPPPPGLYFNFAPHNLALPETTAGLAAGIRKRGTVLVIFDVLARYMPGVDENSVASVGPVMTALRTLATSTGCSLLLLHHFNKGGYASNASAGLRVRGSTDIYGAVDAALTVTLTGRGPGGAAPRRLLTPEKNRQAPEEPRIEFSICAGGNAAALRVEFGAPKAAAAGGLDYQPYLDALLEALAAAGSPLTRQELIALLPGRLPSTRYALNQVFQRLSHTPGVTLSFRRHARTYAIANS